MTDLDHSLVAVTDWERSNAFYCDVLGAELVSRGAGWAYRFGERQLSVHGPDTGGGPRPREPVRPGNSHHCFRWDGPIDDAVAHLERHGVEIELGPVTRAGARGEGMSVYFRDPDGSLLELIGYRDSPPPWTGVAMPEARIEDTPEGQVPAGGGWFILNLGEMAWQTVPGFGVWLGFGDPSQPAVGVHVHVLRPGEANGYYHAEAAQEGFLVLSGECIAIVEGEERRMRRWDYFHSPPGTAHITVGAGDEPCAILMFGSPDPTRRVDWIADETAARHGASVARTTSRGTEVYGEPPPEVRVRPPSPFGD